MLRSWPVTQTAKYLEWQGVGLPGILSIRQGEDHMVQMVRWKEKVPGPGGCRTAGSLEHGQVGEQNGFKQEERVHIYFFQRIILDALCGSGPGFGR